MVSNSADCSGAGLPTTPFGFGNSTGVRGFFPGDRRYPGCGGEKAGAHRVDSYPNARSRPTRSRIPPQNGRAVVAGIKEEVLVWLPRESLVLIRSRRARGHHAWSRESYLSAPRSHGKLGVQKVDGFGRCRHQGAAGALVAAVGPSAAGAQVAQLFWGFVEQDIGIDGYVLHSGRPYSLWFCFLGYPTGLLNDFVVRRGRDSHRLLRQAEE